MTRSRPHQKWVATGSHKGDGANTSAIGIAGAVAAAGKKGLFVDANRKDRSVSNRTGEDLSEERSARISRIDSRAQSDRRDRLSVMASCAEYKDIAGRLLILTRGRPHRKWVVTSAHKGDGSTTTAIGIAAALAAAGKKCLLVDANLRDRSISNRIGEALSEGLTELLQGSRVLQDVCRQAPAPGGYSVIPAGRSEGDPLPMLSAPKLAEVLDQSSLLHDFVLIDAPALGEALDVLAIVPHVDGCILVARAEKTSTRALIHAREQIAKAGGEIVGIVLNRQKQWIPRLFRKWL